MKLRSLLSNFLPALLFATGAAAETPTMIPDLLGKAEIVRDSDGIPHIIAKNEHDMALLQGWAHARDRLFQMDVLRRRASGTLAELFGSAVLADDVELRTVGLRRAAERSLTAISPEARNALDAYAKGVNAYVADHPLPAEYGALELTGFEPWTAVDSLSVAKALVFELSFKLDDIARTQTLLTYQAAGDLAGFDGAALYFEDTHRSAPFAPVATVPEAAPASPAAETSTTDVAHTASTVRGRLRPATVAMAKKYLDRMKGLAHVRKAFRMGDDARGSNEWVIGGNHTVSGLPLLANDPHLDLSTPAVFYQNHLKAEKAGFDVIGASFPGLPYVILGHNRRITWGATLNAADVTDIYQEHVVPDAASPSGLSIVHDGNLEPIIPLPQIYRINQIGDGIPDNIVTVPPGGDIPPVVLIVPRRNNGPIVALDLAGQSAISIQYTGFSGTKEVDTFRQWNRAEGLDDFVAGLQSFDAGSQNWVYADRNGDIAYFTSAEIPLREDLQGGTVNGLPPFFIRNGTGGNDWLPVVTSQPGQAVPFEVLPFEEMPQIVNPPRGFVFNANNDPTGATLDNQPLNQLRPGGGIFYLSHHFNPNLRAGRIKQLLNQRLADGGRVGIEDMKAIQADVVMLDAQVFTPFVVAAYANAAAMGAHPKLRALAADPRVGEAVGRLSGWNHSTPTGIDEGYDASDTDGELEPAGEAEAATSVAATIYSVWRGRMIANTIDVTLDVFDLPKPDDLLVISALRHLLDRFATDRGVGASGLDFFALRGVGRAEARRDIVVLKSLVEALDLLAGSTFDAAFAGSTDQDSYRWGLLHRLALAHPLGEPFSIPPAGGAFPAPLPGLSGIPVDGGFEVVDASRHAVRVAGSDDFVSDNSPGPSRRFVAEVTSGPPFIEAQSSLPGGQSGVLGSPFYSNLLGRWLTNETHRLRLRMQDFGPSAVEKLKFTPATDS